VISEISIKNFRSIGAAVIKAGRITTFVGANDAGKSNVLRALNLYFNGETGHGEPFNFAKDYNIFASKRVKKAHEIEIKVTFKLPVSYRREGLPHEVEWKKVWREEGEVERLSDWRFVGGAPIPARSKINALLDRVRYTYIPAIKDQRFFADLQGRLYDVLSSVAAEPLKNSASDFENQLQLQLGELLFSLEAVFKGRAQMKLPENLREIFENLEIISGDVPMSRRGDGIKIRNIPMILQFIAEKQDQILNRGGVRYTHVWGFEEPENNVEMSSAFLMAKSMFDTVVTHENFQLIMTTHSPIFYKMRSPDGVGANGASTNFVERADNETKITHKETGAVDVSMGLMPLLAPYLDEAKGKFDELQVQLKVARELVASKIPTVFVEGPTDKTVLQRAWKVFGTGDLHLHDGGDVGYGGANAVASRALAWLLEMRHRPKEQVVSAVAVFDGDPAGKEAKRLLVENMQAVGVRSSSTFKLLTYPKIAQLVALQKKEFLLHCDLESMYSDQIWLSADQQGWLEDCAELASRLTKTSLQNVLEVSGGSPFQSLKGVDRLRVMRKFSDQGKVKVAKYVSGLSDENAVAALENFKPLVGELKAFLFPE
jgi:hypothetical protein